MPLACFLLLLLAGMAGAADGDAPVEPVMGYFTVTLENDIFVASDDGYTAGLQLAWARGPFPHFGGDNTTALVARLAPSWIAGGEGYLRGVTHKLAVVMLTPHTLDLPVPPPDEQPYAGLTLWRTDWLRFSDRHGDRAWATLGIVGPASGAGSLQRVIHDATGSQQPRGWDTQLRDEPVLALGAARNWRLPLHEGDLRGMDLVLLSAASAGNLETQVDAGFLLRGGRQLARSFATASLLPGRDVNPLAGSRRIAANLYVGMLWRYQLWNVALDGNLGDPSGSTVTRRPGQYYYAGGVSWSLGDLGFLLSMARSSPLYREADDGDWFGSLSLTWRYR